MSVPYPWSPSPKAAGKFSRNPHLPAWAAPREKVGVVSSHWGGESGGKWFQIREIAHFSEALLDSCTRKGSHRIV